MARCRRDQTSPTTLLLRQHLAEAVSSREEGDEASSRTEEAVAVDHRWKTAIFFGVRDRHRLQDGIQEMYHEKIASRSAESGSNVVKMSGGHRTGSREIEKAIAFAGINSLHRDWKAERLQIHWAVRTLLTNRLQLLRSIRHVSH